MPEDLTKELMDLLRCACRNCGHAWMRKGLVEPKACPLCHSIYWDSDPPIRTPRARTVKEKKELRADLLANRAAIRLASAARAAKKAQK